MFLRGARFLQKLRKTRALVTILITGIEDLIAQDCSGSRLKDTVHHDGEVWQKEQDLAVTGPTVGKHREMGGWPCLPNHLPRCASSLSVAVINTSHDQKQLGEDNGLFSLHLRVTVDLEGSQGRISNKNLESGTE